MSVDEWGRDLTDRALWQRAQTLDAIGELTAQWLEGRIHYHPANLAPGPDAETEGLVPTLARLNRAGFVTDGSQPGEIVGGWQQRAYICGFCDEATMWKVRAAVLGMPLVVLPHYPGALSEGIQVPVTLDGDAENTWLGAVADIEDLVAMYGPEVHADGVRALTAAWHVEMFDPEWGRNDRLWPTLDRLADDAAVLDDAGRRARRIVDELTGGA